MTDDERNELCNLFIKNWGQIDLAEALSRLIQMLDCEHTADQLGEIDNYVYDLKNLAVI